MRIIMLTIYMRETPVCKYCVRAKEYLDRHAIEYQTVDVGRDREALAFLKSRGHTSIPQMYVGETLLVDGGADALCAMEPQEVRALVSNLKVSERALAA